MITALIGVACPESVFDDTMKRLARNFAMFILLVLASGHPAWAASAADDAIRESREAFLDCQKDGLAAIDDGASDANALALTEHCARQYAAMNKAVARYEIDNSNERRMFTIDQNATMIKIEASLPLVLKHREQLLDRTD